MLSEYLMDIGDIQSGGKFERVDDDNSRLIVFTGIPGTYMLTWESANNLLTIDEVELSPIMETSIKVLLDQGDFILIESDSESKIFAFKVVNAGDRPCFVRVTQPELNFALPLKIEYKLVGGKEANEALKLFHETEIKIISEFMAEQTSSGSTFIDTFSPKNLAHHQHALISLDQSS